MTASNVTGARFAFSDDLLPADKFRRGLDCAAGGVRPVATPVVPLAEFVREAWPVVEPDVPLTWNWHIDAICEHLEAVYRGEVRDLVINIPPGFLKSLLVCVFWPAWVWTQTPGFRWIFSSYDAGLSTRDSLKCRRLIQAPWYQGRWGAAYRLTGDQNVKTRFENDATGFRLATSIGGVGTGERADAVVVDDPHNVKQAESDQRRLTVHEWWDRSMSTRGTNPRTFRRVIVMQRVHEDDLSGHVLPRGTWAHLSLPMRYEPDAAMGPMPLGDPDPRTTPGDLLFPERFPEAEVDKLEGELGSYAASGQFQQMPSPAEGGILKRFWWRFWHPAGVTLAPVPVRLADGNYATIAPVTLPDRFDQQLQSWDMAFKDTKGSDFVAGQVWGKRGAESFLLAQTHGRLDFPATIKAVRDLTAAHPQTTTKLVEDKANGPAVISTLRGEIAGLIAVEPFGGKVARAHAVSSCIEAGNIYLPHPDVAPWIAGFLEECAAFPTGAHDDQVDAMTQALRRLYANTRTASPRAPRSRSYITA